MKSALLLLLLAPAVHGQDEEGRALYLKRCFWCHGEEGRGDGPSADGMFPRPRDLVKAEYKIRSTPHGQLPTDDDLFGTISRGLPGTPMPGWETILTESERRQLVAYVKSLSPRFAASKREPIDVPSGSGSAERGRKVFERARCSLCHGAAGRGDGGITATLNYEWGMPFLARDFTRGWTFKGGHGTRDIYLRITGGLDGTPMGPYRDLLSDDERWDLAHYVATLDEEPAETSDDFLVLAGRLEGEIPDDPEDAAWGGAAPTRVALAGQVTLDPPTHWWIPTAGSVTVRALWNGTEIAFLLEWHDPTGPGSSSPDSADLQFAQEEGGKPYFLYGDGDNPVRVWNWRAGDVAEDWSATGTGRVRAGPARFRVKSTWDEGRWRVILRRPLGGEPAFVPGRFVPTLLSVRDGANAERGNVRAISTWVYTTLERPASLRPWLLALAWLLGAVLVELWVLRRLRS